MRVWTTTTLVPRPLPAWGGPVFTCKCGKGQVHELNVSMMIMCTCFHVCRRVWISRVTLRQVGRWRTWYNSCSQVETPGWSSRGLKVMCSLPQPTGTTSSVVSARIPSGLGLLLNLTVVSCPDPTRRIFQAGSGHKTSTRLLVVYLREGEYTAPPLLPPSLIISSPHPSIPPPPSSPSLHPLCHWSWWHLQLWCLWASQGGPVPRPSFQRT